MRVIGSTCNESEILKSIHKPVLNSGLELAFPGIYTHTHKKKAEFLLGGYSNSEEKKIYIYYEFVIVFPSSISSMSLIGTYTRLFVFSFSLTFNIYTYAPYNKAHTHTHH